MRLWVDLEENGVAKLAVNSNFPIMKCPMKDLDDPYHLRCYVEDGMDNYFALPNAYVSSWIGDLQTGVTYTADVEDEEHYSNQKTVTGVFFYKQDKAAPQFFHKPQLSAAQLMARIHPAFR